jgi:hypothetical protein
MASYATCIPDIVLTWFRNSFDLVAYQQNRYLNAVQLQILQNQLHLPLHDLHVVHVGNVKDNVDTIHLLHPLEDHVREDGVAGWNIKYVSYQPINFRIDFRIDFTIQIG